MRRNLPIATMTATLLLVASAAVAQGAKPLAKCPPDAVVAGTVCMDKYEASVWMVIDPIKNKSLVKKIQQGKATIADLAKAGATQLGVASDDYDWCNDNGAGCTDLAYAVSLAGVTPSAQITWFQAQAACENVRKRLPTNAEWQAAVIGTPDPGPDDELTDCNTDSAGQAIPTGFRSGCKSARGAFDMVGNLYEWVADWVPRSEEPCGSWSAGASPTGDDQCLVGALATGEPGALLRGGAYNASAGSHAGPLAVIGGLPPSTSDAVVGFRCAR